MRLNFKNEIKSLTAAITISLLLAACGGGSNDDQSQVSTATGHFIDSAVSGLDYRSGDLSGTTDTSGTFQYQLIDGVAQAVYFEFNGIEIGNSVGKQILTPLDMVAGANLDDIEVQNIARFLQMIDTDADPSNGITPSMDLLSLIAQFAWQQPDFQDIDFDTQPAVTQIVADINSLGIQSHGLPSYQQAAAHLKSNLSCLSSGIFAGRFNGDDNGHYVFLMQHQRIDPLYFGDTNVHSGVGSALIYSETEDFLSGVVPQQSLAFNSANSFVVGRTELGSEFSGQLNEYQRITNGRWRNDIEGISGTFTGNRVAGNQQAVYRLSGAFGDTTPANPLDNTADNSGGIALDVMADNSVTGVMVSTRGQRFEVEGNLNGETITLNTVQQGTASITLDINGSHALNGAAGLFGIPGFWGSWTMGGETGGISGTACILNNNE